MSGQTVLFIGVTTTGSSILDLFPRWMEALDVEAQISGIDLPLDVSPDRYRQVVEDIAADPRIAGAVITSHKLRLFEAASDLFGASDRFVTLCREVNAISKREDGLMAHAGDPLSADATLRTMLGPDYWQNREADVLCFGAGGAATAIAVSLLCDIDPVAGTTRPTSVTPRRLLFVEIDGRRLAALRQVVGAVSGDVAVEYYHHEVLDYNDSLLSSLPPGSLVINATGMGKDRPGSPLSDTAAFPRDAVAWDLNYRGKLTFISQARSREDLTVHDGWLYFLYGWTQALSAVLHQDLTGQALPRLAALAEPFRPTPLPLAE